MMDALQSFLGGAVMMGFLVLGCFFHAFFVRTRDRLFVFFSVAFFVLAFERVVLLLVHPNSEGHFLVYVVRLLAFAALAFGIWDRNRKGTPRS